ncbi:MAG: 16S rRNA (uracil(1498)-N(3))-methyltransferase [SAR324 cluster bacterium]|uniref:Ribosomal RNA small subunit methyltransferase E n=1 Tax=SAR324 cluster bacterium TaxID=2024889 RepID=A0A7X9FQ08_9DELT|nr:16S rRNA (uracil(1498)-N(3))-methyltransferase [SAR324 cluster bacterium]
MSPKKRLFVNFNKLLLVNNSKPLGKSEVLQGMLLHLDAEDSHYLRNVCRLKEGDEIALFDRAGTHPPLTSSIQSTVADRVVVKILSPIETKLQLRPVEMLVFAVCKGDKNDLVVQKATELGVGHIWFWQAERSVLRIKQNSLSERLNRWRRIAESAAEQSGNQSIPEILLIDDHDRLRENLNALAHQDLLRLCCSLSPQALSLHDCIKDKRQVVLAVGPEGDMTPGEEDLFRECNFNLVNLGPAVLRSETAAIVAVAMTQALWRAR